MIVLCILITKTIPSPSMYAVVNMDEYKKEDILSQALDLVEETKDIDNIITQSPYL